MSHSRALEWRPASSWQRGEEGAVDLWRIDLEPRPGDLELLTDEELARADRLIIPAKRAQFIAGRAALREILGRALALTPESLVLEYGEHGKPSVRQALGLEFNLSHSHELGLLAVRIGPGRLGVDIEWRKPGRALVEIAKRFFSASEQADLIAAGPGRTDQLFYRAWAQKEAYLKAWGTGLSFPSNGFSIDMDPGRPARLLETTMPGDAEASAWWLEDLDVAIGYAAALCLEGVRPEVRAFER